MRIRRRGQVLLPSSEYRYSAITLQTDQQSKTSSSRVTFRDQNQPCTSVWSSSRGTNSVTLGSDADDLSCERHIYIGLVTERRLAMSVHYAPCRMRTVTDWTRTFTAEKMSIRYMTIRTRSLRGGVAWRGWARRSTHSTQATVWSAVSSMLSWTRAGHASSVSGQNRFPRAGFLRPGLV